MGTRGPGRAPRARRAIALVVTLLAALAPPPTVAFAATAVPTAIAVAPTCVRTGTSTRLVILGAGWPSGPVALTRTVAGGIAALGTATPRVSPVRQQAGSFSFTATVTAGTSFRVSGAQGDLVRSADVVVPDTCPLQVTVAPPCLGAPGSVQVSGAGFASGAEVPIDVDPFGDAEALPLSAVADKAGAFSMQVEVAYRGAPVPIVATRPSTVGTAVVPATRGVAFVDPCPPPPTVTTTTSTRGTGTTGPAGPTTTVPTTGATTTTSAPPPGGPPPGVPPVTVPTPTPGATAKVSISPTTVRPGRCNVVVVSAAPPALAVVARFADGPPVNGLTGPGGGAVLSVCHPHDSGTPLGPVKVLIGIGPLAPVPVFTILRVPPRPQPPLLRAGSDSRRS